MKRKINNIIDCHIYGQGHQILEELKKINGQIISEDEVKKKLDIKSNLFFEFHESDKINLFLPENNNYIEEYIIFDNQIEFIPETICKLKIQLLGGNLVLVLSIEIKEEYYLKNQPKFYTYFIFKNKAKNYFDTLFNGDAYSNGIQILTTELDLDQVKKVLNNNNNFVVILNTIKTYYK